MIKVEIKVTPVDIEDLINQIDPIEFYTLEKNDEGYYISSDFTGYDYQLLEGMSIGGMKRYTSDIVFIMATDPEEGYTEFIEWSCGASFIPDDPDIVGNIKYIIYEYERKKYNIK